ncbi:MAG: glycosyltransferase, partial [Acidimicrobiales bacterium]
GFTAPVLWVNDVTYAGLLETTPWPSLYDVTDDWLLESVPPRELARRRRLDALLLEQADEVVVCSPALAASRGAARPVTLIPNGVDVAHFRAPRPRPADLPPAPVAVYVGTLQEERLDVALVAELAKGVPGLAVTLVGPDALSMSSREELDAAGVLRLGPRPYRDVPAYLQHADVIIIPHRVTPFTESLDPIKAYECLAVGRPTVATLVAGFRALDGPVTTAVRGRFVAEVTNQLAQVAPARTHQRLPAADWHVRVSSFHAALSRSTSREHRRWTM